MRAYILAIALLCSTAASAQVLVTPDSAITFQVPEDPTTVSSYRIAIWTDPMPIIKGVLPCDTTKGCPDPTTWTPPPAVVFTRDLGKPIPDINRMVTVPIGWSVTQLSALTAGSYCAKVESVVLNRSYVGDCTLTFTVPELTDPTNEPLPPGQPVVR